MLSANQLRLKEAAKVFAKALQDAGGKHILMGGGASIFQGNGRETKDLDFNVAVLNKRILAKLQSAGISVRPHERFKNRWHATVPESSPGAKNATRIDVAVKSHLPEYLDHTDKIDGLVVVANPHLLLVDKIRTFASRQETRGEKITSDFADVLFCASQIEHLKMPHVPPELQKLLTVEVWEAFWRRVVELTPNDKALCELFLSETGLKWERS